MYEYSPIAEQIVEELLAKFDNDPEQFLAKTSEVVVRTLHYILDGEASLEDLEACEKAVFGVKFEKHWVREMGLPRKVSSRNNPHKLIQDTRIAGVEVDVKTTIADTFRNGKKSSQNWMIPGECYGHWCVLLNVNWRVQTFGIGIFHADPVNLNKGLNHDEKVSISAMGQKTIRWIGRNLPYRM